MADRLKRLGVQLELDLQLPKGQFVHPRYPAPFVRMADGKPELTVGDFGLVPSWSKTRKLEYSTWNARSEDADRKASFRGAWQSGQRCIVPADWFVEPLWRNNIHTATRIQRLDGEPCGIAGLWDKWTDKATGEIVYSFAMLTINAASHSLMNQFHAEGKEKRMVVILPEQQYTDWLTAPVADTRDFLQQYPAEALVAEPLTAPSPR